MDNLFSWLFFKEVANLGQGKRVVSGAVPAFPYTGNDYGTPRDTRSAVLVQRRDDLEQSTHDSLDCDPADDSNSIDLRARLCALKDAWVNLRKCCPHRHDWRIKSL